MSLCKTFHSLQQLFIGELLILRLPSFSAQKKKRTVVRQVASYIADLKNMTDKINIFHDKNHEFRYESNNHLSSYIVHLKWIKFYILVRLILKVKVKSKLKLKANGRSVHLYFLSVWARFHCLLDLSCGVRYSSYTNELFCLTSKAGTHLQSE